jgi:hypothetical protein
MALFEQIRVNGARYSWTSVIARVDDEDMSGLFSTLDYEQKRERKVVKGATRGRAPLGKTGGQYNAEPIALTAMRDGALAMKKYLAAKGGGTSYGRVEFTMQLQLVEENNDVVTVTMRRCHIVGSKDAHSEGVDGLTTELSILPESIVEAVNGVELTLFDEEES